MAGKTVRGLTPRSWWLLAAVALVVVAGIIWATAVRGSSTQPAASSSATPSTAGTPSAGPSPQVTVPATPAPSPTPLLPTATPGATADPAPPQVTQAPVALDEAAEPSRTLTIEITSIEAVSGVARFAGETAGPALRVTVEATNAADTAFATPAAVVNLYFGDDRQPADAIGEPGGRPLPAEVPAAGTSSGVYLFSVPEGERDDILIEIELQVGEPIVLFEGSAAN